MSSAINIQVEPEHQFHRLPALKSRYGVSTSTLYRWIAEGRFPSPIKLPPQKKRGGGSDIFSPDGVDDLFRGANKQLAADLIELVNKFDEYWPMTLRAFYYQAVSALLVPHTLLRAFNRSATPRRGRQRVL